MSDISLDKDSSVYRLITRLCENQLQINRKAITDNTVKILRRKAYDILIFNPDLDNDTFWLDNCTDYHCQFLGWEYILTKTYNQQNMADQLEACVQRILQSDCEPRVRDGVFHFLLKLKKPPVEKIESVDSPLSSAASLYPKFKPTDFHLPESVLSGLPKFSAITFDIDGARSKFFSVEMDGSVELKAEPSPTDSLQLVSSSSSYYECSNALRSAASQDQADIQLAASETIWDEVSKTTFTSKRTWESLGNPSPQAEKFFLSEVGTAVYDRIDAVNDLRTHKLDMDTNGARVVRILSREDYMKDLKSLVVGIQSTTFIEIDDDFLINDYVLFEGIPSQLFKQYATLFINVGVCYKGLFAMVTDFGDNGITAKRGYVYNEFTSAVNRYLGFHRAAALNFPSTKGIIQFHAHIRKLSGHLFAVASVCKVGIFRDPNCARDNLNGIELINYLFQKVFTQSDRQVLLVLHALLYPCLQVYFMKYLNPWLMDGIIYDPNEEFFIRKDTKYLQSRGRTYWTRSFYMCDEAIPVFCMEEAKRIFECGQITNLLKLCTLKEKLSKKYVNPSKEVLVRCCLTERQLRRLQVNVEKYELDFIAQNGAPFVLKQMLAMQRDSKLVFNQFLALRKASSMKRIQLEKLERLSKENAVKRSGCALSAVDHTSEDEEAIKCLNQEETLLKAEALNVINFYESIAESASKLHKVLSSYKDNTRKSQPNVSTHESINSLKPTKILKTSKSIPIRANKLERIKSGRRAISNIHILEKERERNKEQVYQLEYGNATKTHLSYLGNKLHPDPVDPEEAPDSDAEDTPNATPNFDQLVKLEKPRNSEDSINIPIPSKQKFDSFMSLSPKFELIKVDSSKNDLSKPVPPKPVSPMRIPMEEIPNVHMHLVGDYIAQSLLLPTKVQLALVKAQLLKHFFVERKYLSHLENLSNFYFLLDSGFTRVLTHNLFKKFVDFIEADEVFCQHMLNTIMEDALKACVRPLQSQRVVLTFISMPKVPHLTDVYSLDCVSLTYDIKWPLNVLFPTKTMRKYDEIFKFMMKVQRVSWVMKRLFLKMKMLRKQHVRHSRLLDISEQYKKIHLWRYIMHHFVQTLQNYIGGEVLQNSWTTLYKTLEDIEDFDELYHAHATYLRQIHFLCLLHQKTSPVRDIILNIFGIFLKFHDYLGGREWRYDKIGCYHPNYAKMGYIFNNFLALAKYFVKICKRIGRAAYQPQFSQLIDVLNINNYYSCCPTII